MATTAATTPAAITAATPAAIRPVLRAAAAPAPRPYVLPGHALSLDEELKLVNGLQANPSGRGLPLTAPQRNGGVLVAASGLISPGVGAAPDPRQTTNPAVGGLVATEVQPRRWLDFQFNYQLSHLNESFATQPGGQSLASFGSFLQEGSVEYLFSRQMGQDKTNPWRAFVGLGGGLLQFSAAAPYSGQTRGAYLVDPGVDIPTHNEHISFRVDMRATIYRAPNFKNSGLANSSWTSTIEPTAGVVFHF